MFNCHILSLAGGWEGIGDFVTKIPPDRASQNKNIIPELLAAAICKTESLQSPTISVQAHKAECSMAGEKHRADERAGLILGDRV